MIVNVGKRMFILVQSRKPIPGRQLVSRSGSGYVEIRFCGEKQEEGSDEEIMDSVVDVVNDTMYRGGELKDCVILVRNGKEGAFVANYLIEYNKRENIPFPIPFISNDSL